MHPILFEFGPLKIYSYGLFVALAFIISTYLLRKEAQRQDISLEVITNLAWGLVIFGMLGARLLYIIQNAKFYFAYPEEILMLHKGGLSFYGGFILATGFAVVFLKKRHLLVLKTLDLFAPYLPLAQAIGRIGCLLNGCCYGKPTDSIFSLHFPGEEIVRVPVQIYSSVALLTIFIILRILPAKIKAKRRFDGQVFLLYCILYSGGRFFLEFLRGDNPPLWTNLTTHQLISLGILAIALITWWRKRKTMVS